MSLLSAMTGWTPWNYITALADIAILAFVIYKLLLLIRGTRAVQLLRGLLDKSYQLVLRGFSKKKQREILGEDA